MKIKHKCEKSNFIFLGLLVGVEGGKEEQVGTWVDPSVILTASPNHKGIKWYTSFPLGEYNDNKTKVGQDDS